jgi:hypothetical protein
MMSGGDCGYLLFVYEQSYVNDFYSVCDLSSVFD